MKISWKVKIWLGTALSIGSLGARAISSYTGHSTGLTQMQIDVSSRDANGLTARDFNIEFLRSLQAYITRDITQKKREQDHVSSQATYLPGEQKLAVIRLQTPRWNSVAVVGLVSEKLTRVVCTHSSAEMVAISDGLCREKIEEVFAVNPEMP